MTARPVPLDRAGAAPRTFTARAEGSDSFVWTLPAGDAYTLPIAGGIFVEASDARRMRWLRESEPWSLMQLPAFGVRYGERTAVVIVPWPHYAELAITERVEVRFTFPPGRRGATPCDLAVAWRGNGLLEVADAFRSWRRTVPKIGALARPVPLTAKARALPAVEKLFGAAHFYLWGPALFSRHDILPGQRGALVKALRDASPGSVLGRIAARCGKEALEGDLTGLAGAIDRALGETGIAAEQFAAALPGLLAPPQSWGDGPSKGMVDALHDAGVGRALLFLSDFYGRTPRPDAAARAAELGYLMGPYDSYHSVHAPDAPPDETWETAQFDRAAYEEGRIRNADGSGHKGFRGSGFHFSPAAAWPYVRQRVGAALAKCPYSAWFVDCDATGECFDDFSPRHPATRVDDMAARRRRLRWLASEKRLVVGSEDGSALTADLVPVGHGTHTPYVGHLDRAFRDRKSPYFLGAAWPPDSPASSFREVPVAPSVADTYFDPRIRLPLYRAALGDEVIGTHHWSMDSLKFSDIAASRALMELLYLAPPLYHVNRATWPQRRERIVGHLAFWAPLHRALAAAPLVDFAWLTDDRLVQRATYRAPDGPVDVVVNFDRRPREGLPALSARAGGKTWSA